MKHFAVFAFEVIGLKELLLTCILWRKRGEERRCPMMLGEAIVSHRHLSPHQTE